MIAYLTMASDLPGQTKIHIRKTGTMRSKLLRTSDKVRHSVSNTAATVSQLAGEKPISPKADRGRHTFLVGIIIGMLALHTIFLQPVSLASPQFNSRWHAQVDRVWVGPDYWANRLQDWQIKDGRLECVEASQERPMRVVHLLSGALKKEAGNLDMSVLTGPVDQGTLDRNTWVGFLIGAGAEDIDYRLTALVHHRPAEDGGLFAGIDGAGSIIFRDFSQGGGGNDWSITGAISENEMPLIDPAASDWYGFKENGFREAKLELHIEKAGTNHRIILTARNPQTGEVVSKGILENVPDHMLDGNVGLVSHRGPENSETGYWFKEWRISGSKFVVYPERRFGPIFSAQYTLSNAILKLTAQMPPLGDMDSQTAELQLLKNGVWEKAAETKLIHDSYIFPFRVENWDSRQNAVYRIVYHLKTNHGSAETYYYEGTIRAEPLDKENFVVAAFTGHKIFTGGLKWNHNGIWFPHNELVAAVAYHEPDLLFFSGDQVYEGDLTGAQYAPYDKAVLDYLDKWYRWCWAFGDLTRNIPTVCILDDHDVYHGNIWGAGGRKARPWPPDEKYPPHYKGFEAAWQQDGGGYKMPPEFVNMAQQTQTSHLPDPFDQEPVEQGIGVYYTDMKYGGISFAIIEDRKWKSSPTLMLPEAQVVNGFVQNPDFDMQNTDSPEAKLLGDRQLFFLDHWTSDWKDVWMKVLLSQTIFANVSTYPNHFLTDDGTTGIEPLPFGVIPANYELAVDMDSNGWPQTARNRALRILRKTYAFHIAGDQHLGSTIQYGVDDWHDGGYAVCVPSIGNTWPRRWYPQTHGKNYLPGNPLYTGDYRDGFGNLLSVHAVSNPIISNHEPAALYDRAPGYGIIRFRKQTREITVEVWPRWVDPSKPDAQQYPGWPIKIHQFDNFGGNITSFLPTLRIEGLTDPVVSVVDETRNETIYTVRIQGNVFHPKAPGGGPFTIYVGEPGTSKEKSLKHVSKRSGDDQREIVVTF